MAIQVVFGLGSNVGDRRAMLAAAVKMLAEQFRVVKTSAVYESAAVLLPGAPKEWDKPYLNMAVLAETTHSPPELLAAAQLVERTLDRKDRGRWGPREIDIDILVYGDTVMNTPQLKIPHPELLKRDFALVPLADIAPGWKLPDGSTAAQAAERMRDGIRQVA